MNQHIDKTGQLVVCHSKEISKESTCSRIWREAWVNTVRGLTPFSSTIRHGLVARIAGSHPAGPGSIPGAGKLIFPYV